METLKDEISMETGRESLYKFFHWKFIVSCDEQYPHAM